MSWQPDQYNQQAHEQRIHSPQQYAPQPPPWQQPGYGQPPYMPPQPPPRRSLLQRHKILTPFLALCGLVVIIAIASAISSLAKPSTARVTPAAPPVRAPAPVPAAHAAAKPQTITYVVSGSPADITYGPAGTSLAGRVPMRITEPLGNPMYYSIQAQLQGGGAVTCEIEVNGIVISQSAASGGYNIAMCEIGQDPLSGQWENDNAA